MMKKTHLAIGAAITIPLVTKLGVGIVPSFFALIGSVAPDYDLLLGIKHRTITHSMFFTYLITVILCIFNFEFGILFGINYGLHLVADSFTKMGTPYLYPINKNYFGLKLFKSCGSEDAFLFIIIAFIISEIIK